MAPGGSSVERGNSSRQRKWVKASEGELTISTLFKCFTYTILRLIASFRNVLLKCPFFKKFKSGSRILTDARNLPYTSTDRHR